MSLSLVTSLFSLAYLPIPASLHIVGYHSFIKYSSVGIQLYPSLGPIVSAKKSDVHIFAAPSKVVL